jgi:methylmalonyl-CoA/ethylmalonyl-CoA epimerase
MVESVAAPGTWRFDHLGLVVKTLQRGRKSIARALGVERWTPELTDPVNGVVVQFGRDRAGVTYELLQPIDETSPVYPALRRGKAILNHVAYLVEDLPAAARTMREGGAGPTGEPRPAIAYGGARIQFFVMPSSFVVELIEAPAHAHAFTLTIAN